MPTSNRVQSVPSCLSRGLKYIWSDPIYVLVVIALSTAPLILWEYFLGNLPVLEQSPALQTIAMAGVVIVAGILATIAQYMVSKRCSIWLKKTGKNESRNQKKAHIGIIIATAVWSGFLLGILPGIRPIIMAALARSLSTSAIVASFIIERVLGWLMMVFLFCYMWPVVIIKGVGPFSNMALTFRSVTAKLSYIIPIIAWISIASLIEVLMSSRILGIYGILVDLGIGTLQVGVWAYQMVAFYTIDSHNNSLEPTP